MSAGPFAVRHRRKLRSTLLYSAKLLLFAIVVFGVAIMLPLELIAYVDLHFDRIIDDVPFPGLRFGRRLYRDADRLDALAREAGLPPLSRFESHDVIETGEPPVWHQPAAALPTVEYLLTRVDPARRVRRDLEHVRAALRSAADHGARFYLLVHSRADMTNAEIAARRRGELA